MLGKGSLEGSICSKSCPVYGAVSPKARIHGSKNPRVEMGVASLSITLNGPLAKFLFTVLMVLHSTGREVLGPERVMLHP